MGSKGVMGEPGGSKQEDGEGQGLGSQRGCSGQRMQAAVWQSLAVKEQSWIEGGFL